MIVKKINPEQTEEDFDMKKLETLLKSEVKKVETAANTFYGRDDCKVTSYGHGAPDEWGWCEVSCEICFNYEDVADHSVTLFVYMPDRRRSYAKVKTW